MQRLSKTMMWPWRRAWLLQAAEFVESMNNTVEAAKAQMEASSKRAEYAETKLGRSKLARIQATARRMNWTERLCSIWEGQLGFRQDSLTVESMKSIRAATALLPQMVADYISHKGLHGPFWRKQKSEAEAR